MKLIRLKFFTRLFSVALLIASGLLCVHTMAIGVDADNFIEQASAKALAEIELGKIAVQKSSVPEVKAFAKKMIENNATVTKDLRELASKKNVQMADEAALLAKSKTSILNQREGESFDVSYINNQIAAHQATITLFKDASSSTDEDVRRLAATSLPRLEQHLRDAEALVGVIARANKNPDDVHEYSN